jgi:hypothetical protein
MVARVGCDRKAVHKAIGAGVEGLNYLMLGFVQRVES